MKRVNNILVSFFLIAAFAFLPPHNNKLTGRWIIYGPDNKPAQEYVDFKKDGMYDVVLPNGEIGEAGYYKLSSSAFSIKNAKPGACGNDYWGVYKIAFHGKDSVSFVVIEDSCTNRRNDIVGGNPGLKRYKKK